jgi:putative spermidine/putrescine transport system permease protein
MADKKSVNWLFKFIAVIAYIIILAPMFVIIIVSFNATEVITFPPEGWSMRWYANIFAPNAKFVAGFINSVKVATIATFFDIVIGVLASISVTKYSFRQRGFLISLFTSPMFIPAIAFGFVLLQMTASLRILTPFLKILIGHIVIILPYIIRNTLGILTSYDWTIEDAAASLGANPVRVFFQITLPIIKPAVISGALLAFLYSFDEAVISSFLTSAKFTTLPVQIINYMEFSFDPTVAAISTILIAISLVLMILMDKFIGLDALTKQ